MNAKMDGSAVTVRVNDDNEFSAVESIRFFFADGSERFASDEEQAAMLPALLSAPPQGVSASDPRTIIAGIRQFGLAADGSDLRDLEAAFAQFSAPQDRDVGAWQPIETAPKDGRRFTFTNGNIVGTGKYINGHAFAADSWQGERDTVPTHWMPLPATPGSASPSPVVDAPIATGERLEAEEKEMFRLADRLGYVCTPEQQHPDSPHVQEQEETRIAIKDEARKEAATIANAEKNKWRKKYDECADSAERDTYYAQYSVAQNIELALRSLKGQP